METATVPTSRQAMDCLLLAQNSTAKRDIRAPQPATAFMLSRQRLRSTIARATVGNPPSILAQHQPAGITTLASLYKALLQTPASGMS